MAQIPSKQLHRSGTLEDLQANLSNREIGFCTTDRLAYYKLNGILFPMGGGIIPDPTENALFMAYDDPEHPGEYIYGWKQLTEMSAPYDTNIKLWSRIAGKGLYAESAKNDIRGRGIADALDRIENPDVTPIEDSDNLISSGAVYGALSVKADVTGITPGIYTKVSVNNEGGVVEGGSLEASDIPEISAEKLTSGTLDPARIGNGSVSIEKLELRKRLKVDGTTVGATEEGDSVVLHTIQAQSDWSVEDTSSPAYIKNKPVLGASPILTNIKSYIGALAFTPSNYTEVAYVDIDPRWEVLFYVWGQSSAATDGSGGKGYQYGFRARVRQYWDVDDHNRDLITWYTAGVRDSDGNGPNPVYYNVVLRGLDYEYNPTPGQLALHPTKRVTLYLSSGSSNPYQATAPSGFDLKICAIVIPATVADILKQPS